MLKKSKLFLTIVFFGLAKTFAQPVISSFSPSSGPVGSSVTINGNNFSAIAASNIVYFGAVRAVVNSATANMLSVKVPAGATFEPITVTAGGLTGYSPKPFITTFTTAETAISDFTFNTNDAFLANGNGDLIIADFDGDGKPDVTGANNGSIENAFYVLRNTNTTAGVLSFADRQPVSTHYYSTSMQAADLDGDGKKDIVMTNYDSVISFYRNTSIPGNISFSQTDFHGTQASYLVKGIHDLDGDGKPEIVLLGELDSIWIYKNTSTPGNISFLPWKKYFTANPVGIFDFADIDADGFVDIIYTGSAYEQTFSVLKNDGSGSFPTKVDFATGNHPYGITAADIDGDGKTDITISLYDVDTVSVYKNMSTPGNISFDQRINLYIPYHSYYCSVNDLNGDGRPDIFASNSGGSAYVFQNISTPGNIQLAPSHLFDTNGTGYDAINSADFDNDNKPDIAISTAGYLYILRNRLDEPNVTSFYPTSAGSLMPVTINGTNFNNVSAVYFGDSAAYSFTIDSPTQITAMVDSGATGAIKVVQDNGSGSLTGFTYISPVYVFQCPPVANTTITSNVQFGNPFQWQVNTGDGNGFVNMVNNTNYSGVTTQTLHLVNVPSSWCAYTYRCLVDGETYSWPYMLNFRNYWNGGVSNNWEDASNWSCGTIPDENTNVIINSGTVVINSNVIVRSLTVNPDVSLSITAGNNLTVTH